MRASSQVIKTALLNAVLVLLPLSDGLAQRSVPTKHILVLYWYNKDYPGNVEFDSDFQTSLRSAAPGPIEYYSEYLEDNRFPGENQSHVLRDYLKQKYAGRTIDVVVANTPPTLNFLIENRDTLFPNSPIVFATTHPPSAEATASRAGATGIVYAMTHRRTLELALKLHPDTEQVFVVSGAIDGDREAEVTARRELRTFEGRVSITYLTNLPLSELTSRIRNLPNKSIVLYVRQRARDQQGGILEVQDILSSIASECNVPIYGMSAAHVGFGIVGGVVWTIPANASKMAEIVLRVANGVRLADIPVEAAPSVPMFDWRQVQRWGIREQLLPSDSVIRFREVNVWQLYKWRIVGAIILFALQALLIATLLIARRRARRSQLELEQYKDTLEVLVEERTAELVQARDQALAANRSKSTFLANMSHELRTPLNAILGFCGIILRDATLPAQHRKDLATVGRSGEHLLGLIDEVLDMAKIETGRVTVESVPLDLPRIVTDTVTMLRELAQAKNLQLSSDISPNVPSFILSDPVKLRQVLVNLLSNAVKYTEKGGITVRVDCSNRDSSAHPIVIIDVEDTGIGIAPDDQVRVFEPFVQAGKTRTKGTGLGLSITREFLKLLGGSIQMESKLGQGSRFHVEIPAKIADLVAPMAHTTGRVLCLEPGQPECRVLVVEDQPENSELLQRLLQTAGFAVHVAEDGNQAIESFLLWCPHFISMDLRLPVLGGLEAAKRIRGLEGGREVKIVAVTASAFASQREEVLSAGFDGFLRKPYRPEEIFDCIRAHLGVRYAYDARSQKAAANARVILRPEDFEGMPAVLREELENAVISLDSKRIMTVLSQVSAYNSSLGSTLGQFATNYTYTPILEALMGYKKKMAAAGS